LEEVKSEKEAEGLSFDGSAYDQPFMFDRFSVNDLYHPLKARLKLESYYCSCPAPRLSR